MARMLPKLVCKLCYSASAWLIGGAARQESPRDWDVVVPFSHWKIAAMLIPQGAKVNAFGGWTIEENEIEIDVWPCDLSDLLTNDRATDIWHPQSGARYTSVFKEQLTQSL